MQISAHTYITNPLATGYHIYLPAIQSFLDAVDEVVVVDGGSDDESLDRLMALRGSERLRVIANDQSHWDKGDRWERPQFAVNRQLGYEACGGDWVIAFDADHLLPDFYARALRPALAKRGQRGVLYGFKIRRFDNGRYRRDAKVKYWAINKRRAQAEGVDIRYGVKRDSGGNERPTTANELRRFTDPATGVEKRYWAGDSYPSDGLLPLSLYKYGHFFFTPAQLQTKLERFERMRARWAGRSAQAVTVDATPYRLISPADFLSHHRHPKVFADFFAAFAALHASGEAVEGAASAAFNGAHGCGGAALKEPLDIVGLRYSSAPGWQRLRRWLGRQP